MQKTPIPFEPLPDFSKDEFEILSAQLQAWLSEAIPLYCESTEFNALPRDVQQFGGIWFSLFMQLNSVYFGGGLADIDTHAAEEILCR